MKINQPAFRYLLSLTPGILVIAGNLIGGYYSLLATVYTMVLLIGVERFITGENKIENQISNSIVPDFILSMHLLMHTLSIATLIYAIHFQILTGSFVWFAALSTGISSGIEGINTAHEMIHRKQKAWQWAGIWNLVIVNYGHFYIEHIKNHHKNVGTKNDPATAKYGETFYRFFLRTVPQQFISAIKIEAERLSKKNLFGYGIKNFVVAIFLLQVLIAVAIYFFIGGTEMFAYLLQSFIAFFLLEYVNYIEHYGLMRDDGKKVNATHSWQSDMPISRFALIELSRHSDHHMVASKPYHTLISHADSPVLPSGYFGSFYYALIPPLWFKLVHPVLNDFKNEIQNKSSL